MNLSEILKQFDKRFNSVWLHDGSMPTESYITCNENNEDIKSFITKAITKALKKCTPKENENMDWGYNSAIADYKEKVKRFLK